MVKCYDCPFGMTRSVSTIHSGTCQKVDQSCHCYVNFFRTQIRQSLLMKWVEMNDYQKLDNRGGRKRKPDCNGLCIMLQNCL